MSAPQACSAVAADRSAADAPTPPLRLLVVATLALGLGVASARWLESGGLRPVSGYLQVRSTLVTADRCCRVLEHSQQAGERISIGDALVLYSDSDLEQRLEALRHQVQTLEKELAQAEARSRLELTQREQQLDDRIYECQLQAADYRKSQQESEMRRTLLADLLASHQSALWDTGESMLRSFVLNEPWPNSERLQTTLQLEGYASQSELMAANVQICETRVKALQAARNDLCDQVCESCGVPLTRLRLEQAQADLKKLESQQSQLVVTSPAVGQVGTFRSHPGAVLHPGDPIVELLDDSQRYLIAQVPSTRINEFKLGRTVTLIFPGNERRQGRVSRVAPQAGPRDSSDPDADPLIEVDIDQAGRLWPGVPIGTRVEVTAESPL